MFQSSNQHGKIEVQRTENHWPLICCTIPAFKVYITQIREVFKSPGKNGKIKL